MLRLVNSQLTEASIEADGESAIVAIDQHPNSLAFWRIDLYAKTAEGRQRMGQLVTLPPGIRTNPRPPSSRQLAALYCPGVHEWQIEAALEAGAADGAQLDVAKGREGQGAAGMIVLWKRYETIAIPSGTNTVTVPIGFHIRRVSVFTAGVAGSVGIDGHGAVAPLPANASLALEPVALAHGPTTVTATDVDGGVIECERW